MFEAKNAYVPKNKAVAELDAAMEQRDADYAVWVVPSEELLPATGRSCARSTATSCSSSTTPRTARASGSRWRTRSPAPARSWPKADGEGVDGGALRAEVERALAAMDDVRRIKSQLTIATAGSTPRARSSTRWPTASAAHLVQIDELVVAGTGDDSPPQGRLV